MSTRHRCCLSLPLRSSVLRKREHIWAGALGHALAVGLWAFLLAGLSAYASQTAVEEITVVGVGFALLLVVIVVGILFDVVGVAAASADEAPLHARSARNLYGAEQAVRLVRHAHRVASVCNDVVGDVSGTLSGAIGVTLVLRVLQDPTDRDVVWASSLMTALIAALVVGGKAFGKTYAIRRSADIMFYAGKVVALVESVVPLRLYGNMRRQKRKRKARHTRRSRPARNGGATSRAR